MFDQLQGKRIAFLTANEGVDRAVGDAEASEYDGLVLPGGVANPDELRTKAEAVEFGPTCATPAPKIVEEFAEGVHEGERASTAG